MDNHPCGWISAFDKMPEIGKRIIACGTARYVQFMDAALFIDLTKGVTDDGLKKMYWMDAPLPPPDTPYPDAMLAERVKHE